MKKYVKPVMTTTMFTVEDVLSTSIQDVYMEILDESLTGIEDGGAL